MTRSARIHRSSKRSILSREGLLDNQLEKPGQTGASLCRPEASVA